MPDGGPPMDSIKRGVKSLLQRLKRDKAKEPFASSGDDQPATLTAVASAPQDDGKNNTLVPDSAYPDIPKSSTEPNPTSPQLETAFEHIAKTEKESGRSDTIQGQDASIQPAVSGHVHELARDPTIKKKENQVPLKPDTDATSRVDSGTEQEMQQSAATKPIDSSARVLPANPPENEETGPGEESKEPKSGEESREESKSNENARKTSIAEDLPPIKPIVLAPGMSATSGPLEDFPEGVDPQ